ncbi:MAG: STAS domain-containing protein [Burkholderiaceae bacterium]
MQLPPIVTHDQASRLCAAVTPGSAATPIIDARALQRFDSSALALMLQMARVASQGQTPRVLGAPPALRALAKAYGIEACWEWADA